MMSAIRSLWRVHAWLFAAGLLAAHGCQNTPVDLSEFSRGPAPLRVPSPGRAAKVVTYEDSLTGGQIYTMYCSQCHNYRPPAERPFSNYRNAVAHMRQRANLTGKEEATLLAWLRRLDDVPPPNPRVEPSPKRFIFARPISELREPPASSSAASRDRPHADPARPEDQP